MRFRLVPPPADIDRLETVRSAVPTEPTAVADCCAHLCQRADVPDRETASEWLVFLQALGLVMNRDGYVRTEQVVDREQLKRAFEQRVYGVRELHEARASGETVESVADELRADDEYVRRLEGWFAAFER